MRWPPVPSLAKIASRAGLSAAAAGGGYTATLLAAPKTAEIVVLSIVLASATVGITASKIVESIWKRRRVNIQAKSEARIVEQLTAETLKLIELARTEPDKAELVKELLYQLAISPLLPPGRRLADEFLAPKLTPPKGTSPPRKPGSRRPRKGPPKKPGSGPPPGGVGQVLDFPHQPPEKELSPAGR